MSYWMEASRMKPGLDGWRESLSLAVDWMIERSQIRTVEHPFADSHFRELALYRDWRGAFRGEYAAASKKWDVFCPIWHGGQGVKALVMAHQILGDVRCLEAARAAGDFILRHRVDNPKDPDHGLILAYEGQGGVNTSAILESLDGLFALAAATGEAAYADVAIRALRWVREKTFLADEGLFADDYLLAERKVRRADWMPERDFPQPGRPLLDDGVFLTGWRLTGEAWMRDVAVRTADRLVRDEAPEGNWKAYPPSHPVSGVIHPRHAFWWGRPLWMVHRATGEPAYLDLCRRSARWYVRAMRSDGGLFRDTDGDFSTPSFGHATSGIACAAILWMDLVREYGDTEWREPIRRALRFCRSVQFTRAGDPNLQGAILEKVVPPAGGDAPPWYLREIGTFFYVQAVCQALRDCPETLA